MFEVDGRVVRIVSTGSAAAEQHSELTDVRGAAVQRMLSTAAEHEIHAQS
jgi:hypothetical protein